MSSRLIFGTMFALLLTASGCITIKLNESSIPPEAKTVSVAYIPTYEANAHPALSQTFTESLRDIFVNQSRLELIADDGDFDFEGEIIGYNIVPVAVQTGETAAMSKLQVTARIRFVNRIETSQSFEQTFSGAQEYPKDQDLQSIELELLDEIITQMVQDIFNKAASNW